MSKYLVGWYVCVMRERTWVTFGFPKCANRRTSHPNWWLAYPGCDVCRTLPRSKVLDWGRSVIDCDGAQLIDLTSAWTRHIRSDFFIARHPSHNPGLSWLRRRRQDWDSKSWHRCSMAESRWSHLCHSCTQSRCQSQLFGCAICG